MRQMKISLKCQSDYVFFLFFSFRQQGEFFLYYDVVYIHALEKKSKESIGDMMSGSNCFFYFSLSFEPFLLLLNFMCMSVNCKI